MHFYDEFTKPQTIAAVRAYKATLVVKDPKAGKETTYSLVRSGATMQAAIGKLPLPAEMYASVTFAAGGKPNRFDFTFPEYSKEPHAAGGPDADEGGADAGDDGPARRNAAGAVGCLGGRSIPRSCRCRFPRPCPRYWRS